MGSQPRLIGRSARTQRPRSLLLSAVVVAGMVAAPACHSSATTTAVTATSAPTSGGTGSTGSTPVVPVTASGSPSPVVRSPGCQPSPVTGAEKTTEAERIRAAVPAGWSAHISPAGTDASGSVSDPSLIAANFPLPPATDSSGSGAIGSMGPGSVFVSLAEYGSGSVGRPLFAHQGLPCPLQIDSFTPNGLSRPIAGLAGTQVFFTEQRRAFALYAVVGSYDNRAKLVPLINDFLAGVSIQPPG